MIGWANPDGAWSYKPGYSKYRHSSPRRGKSRAGQDYSPDLPEHKSVRLPAQTVTPLVSRKGNRSYRQVRSESLSESEHNSSLDCKKSRSRESYPGKGRRSFSASPSRSLPWQGYHKRDKEPKEYSGKTDVKAFLLQFELIAEMNSWTNEECGYQLASCLLGEATEVMGALSKEMARDYLALQQALINRFSPKGRESYFTVQLWNRSCQKGEKVADYGYELKKLAKRAYPKVLLHEQLLVDLYIKGLPSREMRKHIHVVRPTSLEEAITLATTMEAFETNVETDKFKKPKTETVSPVATSSQQKSGFNYNKSRKQMGVSAVGNQAKQEDPQKQDRALLELLEAMQRRLEKLELLDRGGRGENFQNQNRPNPGGQYGHPDYSRQGGQNFQNNNGPSNQRPYRDDRFGSGPQSNTADRSPPQNFPQNSRQNYPQGSRQQPVCYGCGQAGHFQRECPRWKAPQGRNNAPGQSQMNLN
jgi:hypothetical protein